MDFLNKLHEKQTILRRFIEACSFILKHEPIAKEAREYLNSRLTDSATQRMYEFGYFPSDDRLSTLTSLISKEDLEGLNFYYPKYIAGGTAPHGHFSDHNLIMPFKDAHKNIVAVLGRCLLSEEERSNHMLQKYKYSSGCKKNLYVFGLDKAKSSIIKNDYVIGVEGQFDCISLQMSGVMNVVAFGWANVSKYQMFQINRYTKNIVLMFDNDDAGQKGKVRVKNKYNGIVNVKTISPPKEFKDIDEFIRKSNDLEFKKVVIDKLKDLLPSGD